MVSIVGRQKETGDIISTSKKSVKILNNQITFLSVAQ